MGRKLSDLHMRILEKGEIRCRDVEDLLDDYSARDLSCTLRARIDAHVHGCSRCQKACQEYRWTIELASELPDKPLPIDVQNRLRFALNQRLGLNLPLVDS